MHSPSRLRSAEELLEETRQRLNLVEETREEFLNLYTLRGECPNGSEATRTARSAEGARAWSDLFVPDTPDEWIQAENRTISLEDLSPDNAVVGNKTVIQNNTGVQNSAGDQNSAGAQNNAGTQVPQNQRKVTMASPKEKLPKFHGDGTTDPIRHSKTCETIWMANGVTDEDDWVRQFPATLRGVAIDWFSDTSPQKLNTWENVKKEFIAKFRLL